MAVLTDEQTMLRDMASDWVRDRMPVSAARRRWEGAFDHGHDPEAWAEIAGMGWCGVLVPEEHGGSDFGYLSMGLLLEEMGRTLVASPLLSSALVATVALRRGGSAAQQARYLPAIADGSLVATLAVDEGAHHRPAVLAATAVRVADGWRLDGVKRPVPDATGAGLMIVAASDQGEAQLFLVDADTPGVSMTPLDQIDATRPAIVTLDGVALGAESRLTGGAALLDHVLDAGRIGLAAEMLGMATQAFETTLDYLRTRVQFGRPVGTFQALQHRAASMFGELQLLRSAVEAALAALDAGDVEALPGHASLAKALAGETLNRISSEMVQLHGGIGMTHEHDAGLYLKRARVADQRYGNMAFHRERWGRLNGF